MPNAKGLIERARMFEERTERAADPISRQHYDGGPLSLAISRASGSNAARTRMVALTFAAAVAALSDGGTRCTTPT